MRQRINLLQIVTLAAIPWLFAPTYSSARPTPDGPQAGGTFGPPPPPKTGVAMAQPVEPWLQYGHNAHHTHRSHLASSPGFSQDVSVTPVGRIQSSPAVTSDGRVFIGTDSGWLYSYDDTMSLRWSFKLGGAALYSSPAVVDDASGTTIFIGDDTGLLWAITDGPSAGTFLWKSQLTGMIMASPTVSERFPFFGTKPAVYATTTNGDVFAFDVTGVPLWTVPVGTSFQSCSPAVVAGFHDNLIYVGTDEGVQVCIRDSFIAGVSILWSFPTEDSADSLGADSSFSPAVDLDLGTVYFGFAARNTGEGRLYARNLTTGQYMWPPAIPYYSVPSAGGRKGFLYYPAVGPDHRIYVGSEDFRLYVINGLGASRGTLSWKRDVGGWIHHAPAIGNAGSVYVGCDSNANSGGFHCIETTLGTIVASFSVDSYVHASPAIARFPGGKTCVYFAEVGPITGNGTLHRFE